jgi:hypothetical protein
METAKVDIKVPASDPGPSALQLETGFFRNVFAEEFGIREVLGLG